jgi:hypothetical protein
MSVIRKIRYLKFFLHSLLILNSLLVLFGGVALARYLETNSPTLHEMIFVGFMTLMVGFVIPALIFWYLSQMLKQLRKDVMDKVNDALVIWFENSALFEDDGHRNPLLWLNLSLSFAETAFRESEHPAAGVFMEISPLVREQIRSKLNSHSREKKSK